jgi:hypothetical protein
MQSYKMAQERIVTYRGFQRKGLGFRVKTSPPCLPVFISRLFGKERSGRDLRMADHLPTVLGDDMFCYRTSLLFLAIEGSG